MMILPESEDDDEKLWGHVTRDVKPIQREPKTPDSSGKKAGTAKAPRAYGPGYRAPALIIPDRRDLDPPKIKRRAPDVSSRQIDLKTEKRLKRGKIEIEGRLDLHGYTLVAAHRALRRFIVQSHEQGMRCVLVVTGKGDIGPAADGERQRGAIRREVPIWLNEDPLNHLVLQAVPARPEDGGVGALYVYLRRTRA